jgi:hypothetical protein
MLLASLRVYLTALPAREECLSRWCGCPHPRRRFVPDLEYAGVDTRATAENAGEDICRRADDYSRRMWFNAARHKIELR